ncbi:hypothetical protein TEA_005135 [Camellia sinensis var. sinensis]|uniref:Protein VACUOLELESS1 n=1 Tax=Camellia sinensis var. sinensis TaxID=542762 RepID=A0A4S4EA57_CAMSN|nr:hypothetical protein TEA_005135 [Camellia sinensis var. sinensis]
MAAVSVAAEWQLLYNRYYRKPEIYPMQWKHVDLSRNKVACASFGGPIAVIRDDSKIVQLYAESALRKLRIFNSAGVQISETVWKNPGGRLIGMSWTDDQILVFVTQDGTVYQYNIHSELIEPNLSMGKECFDHSVVECVFWGNGLVCINEANQLFCIPDFKNPKPCKLADPNLEEFPLCAAVIEPQYTMSGNVEVLLGVDDHVLLVEEDGVQQVGIGLGPLQKMVVSRNGKLLASFTHDGRLLVMSTDFSKIIFEYSCEVGLHLTFEVQYIRMRGRHNSLTVIENINSNRNSNVAPFAFGDATDFSMIIFEYSYEADENLRLIHSSLPEAVEACIDAAGHEFDVSRQRTLLRAASYGQAFSSHFQRDRFQEMCKTLRVLNAVRNYDIGIPLSIQQYKLLTPSVLVGRLINAHHHVVALRISEYLGMNQEVSFLLWKESWELAKNPMASKGSPLHGPRIKLIEKAQSLFVETKEHTFESKAAEEHAKLLRIQHDLEVATKQAIFVDSSISDTIRTCIVLGNHRAAMKVRTEFKVSEKRWYWLKVFALATIRDWDALEKFSKEKRPPIGYRPFVESCIDADEKGEALKYIPKLADPRERAEAYARIGMAKEAADAASQAKDGELLGRLKLSFAQNAAASSIFDTLRDRLSFQGVS